MSSDIFRQAILDMIHQISSNRDRQEDIALLESSLPTCI
jgi:hypothetical protein